MLRGLFFQAWGSLTSLKSQTQEPQLKVPPGGLVLRISMGWKNPSTSAGFEPANFISWSEHVTPRPSRPTYTSTNFHSLCISVMQDEIERKSPLYSSTSFLLIYASYLLVYICVFLISVLSSMFTVFVHFLCLFPLFFITLLKFVFQ